MWKIQQSLLLVHWNLNTFWLAELKLEWAYSQYPEYKSFMCPPNITNNAM